MDSNSKYLVTGITGMVGSAVLRGMFGRGYMNDIHSFSDLPDLRNQRGVNEYFERHRPEYVFHCAAKVGGINFNKQYPAEFIYDNLMIQTNVIDAAYRYGVKKLVFLGSACIYPRRAIVPIKEESLMTGPLEPTNDAYAIAKIAGLKMCQAYAKQYGFNAISVMPNNLYGRNDNFKLDECHVIPAFIRKFIEAKETGQTRVVCFGDGTPTREFLYVDDLADGLIFLMNNYDDPSPINIGPNREVSIRELAEMIAKIVGYSGDIIWDTAMPNGTMRRTLDTVKMDALGWKAKTSLEEGLEKTIKWYYDNRDTYARV